MASHTVFAPYTDDPSRGPSVIFPSHGYQIFCTIISLLGISVVSFLFARRTATENLFSLDGWRRLSWPRLCVIGIFFSSWAFIFSAAVLISGAGLSLNSVTCTLGIFSCIVLYALTKILIYAFLIEKVWIVWTPRVPTSTGHPQPSRWKSPIYRACMFTLSIFLVIVFLLVFGRIAEIHHDGVCVIGLKQFASLSLLSFDLFITLCLTILFVYPLMRKDIISPRLRRVAKRTLAASIAALITSAVNLAVLTIMHGKQLGWVCLSSCGTDVTLNAIIIFWVTAGTSASHTPPHPSLHLAQSTAPPEDSKYDRNLGYLRTLEPPGSNARLANQWRAQDSIFEQDDGQNTYAEDRRSDKRDLKLISPIGNEDRDGPIRQTLSYTEPRSPPSALSRSIQVFHCSQPSPLESSVSFPSHGILHVQAIGKDPLQPTMAVSIPPFIRKSPFTPSDTGDLEVGGKAHGSGSTSCASLGKSDSPSIVIPVEIVASTSKDANQNQRVSYYVRSSSRTPSDHSAPTSPVPPTSSHPTIQRRATDGDLNGRGVLKGLGDFVHRRTRKDSNAPRGRSKVPGQSESQERRSQSMLTTQATDVSAIEFRRHGSDLESFSCTNDSNSTPYVHQYSTNRMHRPSTVREGISTDDYLKDSSEVDHNSSTLDHHSKRDRKTSQQLCPTSPSISSSQSPDPRPHRTRYSSSIFSSKSNKPR